MGLMSAIGEGPICLDTAIFIYFIEEHEQYLKLVNPIFKAMDSGKIKAVTSSITLFETLVIPLRTKDEQLANEYEHLLLESRGLTILHFDSKMIRQAAELRTSSLCQKFCAEISILSPGVERS